MATKLTAADIRNAVYGSPQISTSGGEAPFGFDPTGITLKLQARDAAAAARDAQRTEDYGAGGNTIDQAIHMTGPLPDPAWQAFFQALKNRNVENVAGAGPFTDTPFDAPVSMTTSRQLRGVSAQPDYLTTGDTFMGRPTALGALKTRARPMLPDQSAFETQLYAARGRPGTDVTKAAAPKQSTLQRPVDGSTIFTRPSPTAPAPTDDQAAALAWLRARAQS